MERINDLAIALWKENSRECKILATYIMPAEKINADIVYLWLEQIPTQEIAELLSFNLLRNIDLPHLWHTNALLQIKVCIKYVVSRH